MSSQADFNAIVQAAAAAFTAGNLATATPALLASLVVAPAQSNGLPAGVAVVDSVNGLVSADPAVFGNPDLAGWSFCVKPAESLFDHSSQAAWTINLNTTDGARADSMGAFRAEVWPLVASGNPSTPWQYAPLVGAQNNEVPWLPKTQLFGGEFGTWEKVTALLAKWKQPSFNPNQFGG